METFTVLTSRVVPLIRNDVDTDQILPARFLKVTDKLGLGDRLFHDWRYTADGKPDPSFILNDPAVEGAQILLAGDNFGCGSSREHAPWALAAWGFRALISTSFADIFRGNALKNGILPIVVDSGVHAALIAARERDAAMTVTVDLAAEALILPDGGRVAFPIDAFSKRCLSSGLDELGYLLSFTSKIEAYEAAHH